MEHWHLPARLGALTVALLIAGLLRDPDRGHLVPREEFVWLVQGATLATGLAVLFAARRERTGRAAAGCAAQVAGALLLGYALIIGDVAEFKGHGEFPCGTAMMREIVRVEAGIALVLGAGALAVAWLLARESGPRKWRCAALWLAMAAGIPYLSVVLERDRRKPTNYRRCYANQKTIVGAIEVYELDRNTRVPKIDGPLFELLRSGGYLQFIPNDTDFAGPDGWRNYQRQTTGNGITCTRHGPIQ